MKVINCQDYQPWTMLPSVPPPMFLFQVNNGITRGTKDLNFITLILKTKQINSHITGGRAERAIICTVDSHVQHQVLMAVFNVPGLRRREDTADLPSYAACSIA